MAPKSTDTPSMPVFFDECAKHEKFEARLDRIEAQGSETLKSVLQQQRNTDVRFGDIERKMDRNHEKTTGEIVGLREAVTTAMLAKAKTNGVAQGRAEVTDEIKTTVKSWATTAKWVAGIIGAMGLGGGLVEGIRRLLGG